MRTLTDRFRRGTGEDGYIGITVLGVMMLLLATSLAVFGSVRDQVVVTRNNQEFTTGTQGMGDAYAGAMSFVNSGSFNPAVDSTSPLVPRDDGIGEYRYHYDAATRTLHVRGLANPTDAGQKTILPLRWLGVGSQTTDAATGRLVYGVAANSTSPVAGFNAGIWSYGLATSANRASTGTASIARGVFTSEKAAVVRPDFDFAHLGGDLTLEPSSPGMRVTRFADSGSIGGAGWSDEIYRSQVTLQYDYNLLRNRATGTPFQSCLANPPVSGALASAALYCAKGNYTLPTGTLPPSTGVATVVVRGNLTLPADVNSVGSGQIHFYVTGNVTFAKPTTSGPQQQVTRAFVYAPFGDCAVSGTQALWLRGALACRSVYLPSNSNRFTYVSPVADTSAHTGAATRRIYYTESAGYVDYLTP